MVPVSPLGGLVPAMLPPCLCGGGWLMCPVGDVPLKYWGLYKPNIHLYCDTSMVSMMKQLLTEKRDGTEQRDIIFFMILIVTLLGWF